jgi:hypothetical protein
MEPKTKGLASVVQDPIALINQKLYQMNTQFVQTHNQSMNRLTTLERYHHSSKPQFVGQPNAGWKPRPPLEDKEPDTLDPVGMVNLETFPWCFPCQEPHSKDECPRKTKEDPGVVKSLKFIDISTLQDDECIDVIEERLAEFRKRAAR